MSFNSSPAGVCSLNLSSTLNEGAILWFWSSTRNSPKSPVLARSSGRTPMIWTGRVITWPPGKRKWRIPGVSMVGAWAITSSPPTCATRAMTSSEL